MPFLKDDLKVQIESVLEQLKRARKSGYQNAFLESWTMRGGPTLEEIGKELNVTRGTCPPNPKAVRSKT